MATLAEEVLAVATADDIFYLHELCMDISGINLTEEDVRSIVRVLPDDILREAIEWGLSEIEVMTMIDDYIMNNRSKFDGIM